MKRTCANPQCTEADPKFNTFRRKDRICVRSKCNVCHNKQASTTCAKRRREFGAKPSDIKNWEKQAARERNERQNPAFRAKYILKDSRGSDSKRGMGNDLSIEIINELIASGCYYCGEIRS